MFEKIDEIRKLLKPMLDAVSPAKNKSIITVVGATGAGKSSLVNYMNGSRYDFEYNDLMIKKPLLKPGSKDAICKVGEDDGESKTLYPQIVQLENEKFAIADLGGFFDSRAGIEGTLIDMSPHILSRNASKIKGIIWVISFASLTESKGKDVREMLSYFSKISDDTQLLVDSLSIIITKGDERVPKIAIINQLNRIINQMPNGKEKDLLQSVVEKLHEQKDKIVIHNQFDNGESAQHIKDAIGTFNKEGHAPSLFNFSEFNSDQETFNQCLNDASSWYLEKKHALETKIIELEGIQNKIQKLQSGYSEKSNQEVASNKNKITAIDEEYQRCELASTNNQNAINALVKNSQDYVTVGRTDVNIAGQTIVLHDQTDIAHGTSKGACNRMYNWWKKKELDGWTLHEKSYGGKRDKFQYFATKTLPGIGYTVIAFPQTFPVSADYSHSPGISIVPESLKNDAGYSAKIQYSVSSGCNFTVTYKTLKQYSEEGKKELASYQKNKDETCQKMSQLRQDKSSLEKLIVEKESVKTNTQKEIKASQKDAAYLEQDIEAIQSELGQYTDFFQSVCDITKILDLSKSYPSIQQFESYFPKENGNMQDNRYVLFSQKSQVNPTHQEEAEHFNYTGTPY